MSKLMKLTLKDNRSLLWKQPIVVFLLFTLVILATGCESQNVWLSLRKQNPSDAMTNGIIGPGPEIRLARRLSQLKYPKKAPLGDDLDIIVRRRWQVLELINRTPNVYRGMQLWLNQEYIGEVDQIDIQAGNIVPLNNLINHHGESYPVGGMLNPDKTFPVLVAELYDPRKDVRYRLLVLDA